MVSFDCVFLTPENADIFPILICRNNRHGQTGVTCGERKDPTSYLISFLLDWRIFLKDENELNMKVFQVAMIQSCVEVTVREMKKDNAEFSEFPLNITQVRGSQMTFRHSIGFFISQCNS